MSKCKKCWSEKTMRVWTINWNISELYCKCELPDFDWYTDYISITNE